MQMVSPNGTVVELFNKGCGSTDSTLALQFDDSGAELNCSNTTTQIVVPVTALSAFNGENPQGTWTLKVRDAVSGRFGTINSASINICSQTFNLGVEDPKNENFVTYPNPTRGVFTIQFTPESKSGVQVFVHDAFGRTVYHNTFESTTNFHQDIDLKNIAPGIYFVKVIDGSKKTVKKIIIY